VKIGVISDTHGYLDEKVFYHFSKVDEIWHAGDIGNISVLERLEDFKPVRAVWGNIDGHEIRSIIPENNWFNLNNKSILITHIAGYPRKYNSRIQEIFREKIPNLLICGHSHILKIMKDPERNNLLYINPGAAGKHGLHKVKTLVRFDITENFIENLEVIELGKRGSV